MTHTILKYNDRSITLPDENEINTVVLPSSYAYQATKLCGCTVAAIVDLPDFSKEISICVATWLKAGLKIERVPAHQVTLAETCPHEPQQMQLV